MVVDGPMTGEMFLAYVKQCLVPTLRRNDIVVMDDFLYAEPVPEPSTILLVGTTLLGGAFLRRRLRPSL